MRNGTKLTCRLPVSVNNVCLVEKQNTTYHSDKALIILNASQSLRKQIRKNFIAKKYFNTKNSLWYGLLFLKEKILHIIKNTQRLQI